MTHMSKQGGGAKPLDSQINNTTDPRQSGRHTIKQINSRRNTTFDKHDAKAKRIQLSSSISKWRRNHNKRKLIIPQQMIVQ
ncbi:hypothetical protein H5410_012876 [Solanum commersonii]|uniref:Uncharacterized protein n=1 Tax=Solanum commersonii TaxID=4109 RepID=A0A9J6ATW0_SOLCO|nr:hypothetical protein H5410_012876 [Solanum commersonii]